MNPNKASFFKSCNWGESHNKLETLLSHKKIPVIYLLTRIKRRNNYSPSPKIYEWIYRFVGLGVKQLYLSLAGVFSMGL